MRHGTEAMNTTKPASIVAAAFAMAGLVCSAAVAAGAAKVSISRLTATPERFDGKPVQLSGYVRLEFENQVICRTQTPRSTKECLWLDFFPRPVSNDQDADAHERMFSEWKARYHGKRVALRAVFDAKDLGHLGLQSGTLRDIVVVSVDDPHRGERR